MTDHDAWVEMKEQELERLEGEVRSLVAEARQKNLRIELIKYQLSQFHTNEEARHG